MTKEVWYRAEESTVGTGYVDEYGDWHRTGDSSVLIRIHELEVLKRTPKGVWLKHESYGYNGTVASDRRFVLNECRKRFACPTIKEALDSFVARKERQAEIYEARARTARRAIKLARTGTVTEIPHMGLHRIEEDYGFKLGWDLAGRSEKALTAELNNMIDAWEALPGGRNYSIETMQRWLSGPMNLAINRARRFLGRSKPEPAE